MTRGCSAGRGRQSRAAGAHAPWRVGGCGQLHSHAATLRLPLRGAGPRRVGGRAGVQQQPALLAVERSRVPTAPGSDADRASRGCGPANLIAISVAPARACRGLRPPGHARRPWQSPRLLARDHARLGRRPARERRRDQTWAACRVTGRTSTHVGGFVIHSRTTPGAPAAESSLATGSAPAPGRRSAGAGRRVPAGSGSAAARCRPRRSSAGQNAEVSLRAEIVLELCGRVLQRHVVLLEQRVHLEARVKPQQPAHLRLRQGTGAIGFNRNGFE